MKDQIRYANDNRPDTVDVLDGVLDFFAQVFLITLNLQQYTEPQISYPLTQ